MEVDDIGIGTWIEAMNYEMHTALRKRTDVDYFAGMTRDKL